MNELPGGMPKGGLNGCRDRRALSRSHNPKVAGSNPAPATNEHEGPGQQTWAFVLLQRLIDSSTGGTTGDSLTCGDATATR